MVWKRQGDLTVQIERFNEECRGFVLKTCDTHRFEVILWVRNEFSVEEGSELWVERRSGRECKFTYFNIDRAGTWRSDATLGRARSLVTCLESMLERDWAQEFQGAV